MQTPTVPKPSAGLVVHAKAAWRSSEGGMQSARVTLGDDADDDKYVSEMFTIGGDHDSAAPCEDSVNTDASAPAAGGGWRTENTQGSYARHVRQGLDSAAIDASAVVVAPVAISAEEARKRQFVREQVCHTCVCVYARTRV